MFLELLRHLKFCIFYDELSLFSTKNFLRSHSLSLLGHCLEVRWVDLSGLAVLGILDAADEIVLLQLVVQGRAVFNCYSDLTLTVRLNKVWPCSNEQVEAAGYVGYAQVALARRGTPFGADGSLEIGHRKGWNHGGLAKF